MAASYLLGYIHTSAGNSGEFEKKSHVRSSIKMFQGCSHSYLFGKHIFVIWNCEIVHNDHSVVNYKTMHVYSLTPTSAPLFHIGLSSSDVYVMNAHFLCWNKNSPPVGFFFNENPLYLLNLSESQITHLFGGRQKMGDMQVWSWYILVLRWRTGSKNAVD